MVFLLSVVIYKLMFIKYLLFLLNILNMLIILFTLLASNPVKTESSPLYLEDFAEAQKMNSQEDTKQLFFNAIDC